MKITFTLHYNTTFGQEIFISGSNRSLGNWNESKALKMTHKKDGIWETSIESGDFSGRIDYKYFLREESGGKHWEWGHNHFIGIKSEDNTRIIIDDNWRNPAADEKAFYTTSFLNVIMKPGKNKQVLKRVKAKKIVQFNIEVPRINSNSKVCILGNQDKLGNWDRTKALILDCDDQFPLWSGQLAAANLKFPIEYKFGIWDLEKQEAITLEEGDNRYFAGLPELNDQFLYIKVDSGFRYPLGLWKGVGVSVPVFSLRSEKSFGVGEFNDLLDFMGWAKQTGMKMVQILPVNETVASHNWLDSYPYKSISVMALHPIYLNLNKTGTLKDQNLMNEFASIQKELNKKTHVDYPEVHRIKSRYYKLIFDQDGEKLFQTEDYKKFFETNKEWLVPYAAFVYLRDKFKSPDFRNWDDFRMYNKAKIEKLSSPKSKVREHITIHYFIQYHLDKQLKEVSQFARNNGIILKGDIPIGISPNSVEAWTEPHLFNLNAQAGAPPDEFAEKGQNWGFPTYNWEEMEKDGYSWWINRMQKMADYFDTYRIDHILGFFRIWEVPSNAVEALLGHFNPALPFTAQEIRNRGVSFNYERYALPYIRHHLLYPLFGEYTETVIHKFLVDSGHGSYQLKEEFNSQKKINQYFLNDLEEEDLPDQERKIRNGLFDLVANVLFVSTGIDQWHPRISLQKTSSYAELDAWTKEHLNSLYLHYFYKRHEEFWYQKGMQKLPVIVSVGNMLVCGEDLGMIPECVPKSMKELGILSLEIQRMPKDPKVMFAHPADAPYLSVCTTSTHDMSTIRGWWEENRELTQLFHNKELGNFGEAPYFAEPWICLQIITQHMYSPAMWATFPIQDLLAINGTIRWEETHLEQINFPSNVRHKWSFRMKQKIDDLKQADEFNEQLKALIKASGRNSDY